MTGLALSAVLCSGVLVARMPWAVARSFARIPAVRAGPAARAGSEAGGSGRTRDLAADRDPPSLDVLVLLHLLDAAIAAGVSVPRALGAVGAVAGGDDAWVLRRASSALVLGSDWEVAWRGAPVRLEPVIDALALTWVSGAAPGPALTSAADQLRRARRDREREAVGRLGVHLVLPLGLCFLPAFMLIGVVPVLISFGESLVG